MKLVRLKERVDFIEFGSSGTIMNDVIGELKSEIGDRAEVLFHRDMVFWTGEPQFQWLRVILSWDKLEVLPSEGFPAIPVPSGWSGR